MNSSVLVPLEAVGPKLASLLALPGLTDLLVNGWGQVWAQRAGSGNRVGSGNRAGLEQLQSPFESEAELGQLAQRLIGLGGRHLDQSNPFADVSIGGLRVHAALASGCNPETLLSIRVHMNRLFGLDQLAQFGMFDEAQLALLKQIIQQRKSFLISGSTGSGKTTLLRAMLSECVGERVIALEDVAELGLQGANFLSLQTRQSNIEGRGEITLSRLVREALRMRPDRIAVGEVRGAELITMLQALNTGHQGAGTTIHANSVADVMPRVHAIGRAEGYDHISIAEQMHSAFSWLIHVDSRQVIEIVELNKN